MLLSGIAFGQDLPDKPADALKEYMSKREGYKRSSTKQFSRTEQYEMDDYCFAMEKKFPEAWQTDFMWYVNGHFWMDRGDKISNAFKKAPNEKMVVKAMFGYAVMTADYGKQKELASKVLGYYSSNTLSYYEDVFPTAGVVIVPSEKDALPMYALQLKKGKGNGVTVVNMDYLINDDYRKSMAGKLKTGDQKFFGEESAFISKALSGQKIHLSTTASQSYLGSKGNKTFVVGLTYETDIANQQDKLQKFWSCIATKNFASMSLSSSEKRLYTNYLPPLLTLYKIKLSQGKKDPAIRKAIVVLADKVGQSKTIEEILNSYENG